MGEQVRQGSIGVREAGPEDAEFLVDMLLAAFNWTGEERYTRKQILKDKSTSLYVAGWQREGDLGVIAVDLAGPSGLQIPVGAAWVRRFPARNPGFGFVAEDVPELSVAVLSHHRGRGIGSGLIRSLAPRLAGAGITRVSLSVEHGNPARALYERLGFTAVTEQEGATTMVADVNTLIQSVRS
ncbi:GNAT family N-acetyltransferase [Ruania halotolerans]|uniref:GNAT family N-acetyltransferase n=1 Tax=Ruania halotolerans TaxID=2897773 RepID=UPI001E3855C3|nr:GNAT family N-acetyltransferase [Ruania halotolerans]UFU07437.1 GNAT family N-acetyltransferase [Ruania halotolerans]